MKKLSELTIEELSQFCESMGFTLIAYEGVNSCPGSVKHIMRDYETGYWYLVNPDNENVYLVHRIEYSGFRKKPSMPKEALEAVALDLALYYITSNGVVVVQKNRPLNSSVIEPRTASRSAYLYELRNMPEGVYVFREGEILGPFSNLEAAVMTVLYGGPVSDTVGRATFLVHDYPNGTFVTNSEQEAVAFITDKGRIIENFVLTYDPLITLLTQIANGGILKETRENSQVAEQLKNLLKALT